jgi:CO dehydrogenase nickel-insertion accessory protein CooC1
MAAERFVVLGLAAARSAWFREVAHWATDGSAPIEFVKAVSAGEVRARLDSGRPFSALVADGALAAVDRDLVDHAAATGCAVLVVADPRVARDWRGLGATDVLPEGFDRTDLVHALEAHARTIARSDPSFAAPVPDAVVSGWRGRFVAVTGAGGTGRSTVAMAITQGLADDVRYGGLVLLVDAALRADLALLHGTGDVVPGLSELVDAHRSGRPTADDVRALTFDVTHRGYHLLLGLRRHRDWVVLRRRALEATLDSLLRNYRVVVADVDADLEGEDDCGSADVEDRNLLARTLIGRADAVVAVGAPGPKGLVTLERVVGDLLRFGVDPARTVLVLNRAARSAKARAAFGRAVVDVMRDAHDGLAFATPVYVPERRHVDDLVGDPGRLPAALTGPPSAAVKALLDRVPSHASAGHESDGVCVTPGSLGAWSEDAG